MHSFRSSSPRRAFARALFVKLVPHPVVIRRHASFGGAALVASFLAALPAHAEKGAYAEKAAVTQSAAAVGELPPVDEAPAPPAAPSGESWAATEPGTPATSTPSAASDASGSAEPDESHIQRDYHRGNELMLEGRFTEAALLYERVAREAKDPADRGAAAELAAICRKWTETGMRLVRPGAPLAVAGNQDGAAAPVASGNRRRSTDEIATLYVNSLLYGVGSGAWTALLTQPDDASGFFLPTFAFAGAAVGAVAIADHGEGLRYGVPQSISSGMYIGLGQGLIWSAWQIAEADRGHEMEPEEAATVMWASSTLGAIAGGIIGQTAGTTPGRASYVGSTTLWGGVVSALTTGGILDIENDSEADENTLLAAAIGTTGGALAGVLTASDVSPSIGRVRFIDLGGLAGALVGSGLYLSAADESSSSRGLFWATDLGTCAGLLTAWFATAGMEPDWGDDAKPSREARPSSGGLSHALASARATLLPARGGVQLGLTGEL